MIDDETQLLVVDAANVVGSRPDGWWRDRAGAARRLLDRLGVLSGHLSADIVVVLEGAAKKAVDEHDSAPGRIRVVAAEGSGDDAIVGVVAAAVDAGVASVVVVTADRGLRDRVAALRARTTGPREFLDRIDSLR
ncbi:NYN domain-containing protein [Nocardia sp. CDC159]|uniref:NYN domain-containing protein n=1 Tax=Nocardia pulmonis TaxID=2951408 RepID=A0A9X2J0R1_9NOCA|nr:MULTISPECIES: NYN domain-containing protein [Nocardia]MCM6778823.1 NYN domain-containing protein [Nocardia pulmonis]MCM6791712.1 NYN domain-containing protein [Nocardia sp. CDC159]